MPYNTFNGKLDHLKLLSSLWINRIDLRKPRQLTLPKEGRKHPIIAMTSVLGLPGNGSQTEQTQCNPTACVEALADHLSGCSSGDRITKRARSQQFGCPLASSHSQSTSCQNLREASSSLLSKSTQH